MIHTPFHRILDICDLAGCWMCSSTVLDGWDFLKLSCILSILEAFADEWEFSMSYWTSRKLFVMFLHSFGWLIITKAPSHVGHSWSLCWLFNILCVVLRFSRVVGHDSDPPRNVCRDMVDRIWEKTLSRRLINSDRDRLMYSDLMPA